MIERAELSALAERIVDGLAIALRGATRVAFADYPFHTNAGDSLIWLGTREALARLGVEIVEATHRELDPRGDVLSALPEDIPILIQGGGNFGNLWPEHQDLRLAIFRGSPARRVVQLPQSLDFRDADRLIDDTRAALAQRPNVTLMWRDTESRAKAGSLFPHTDHVLIPDMGLATSLTPFHRARSRSGTVVLARTDHEGSRLTDAAVDVPTADWRLTGVDRYMWTALRRTVGQGRVGVRFATRIRYYDWLARHNVQAAVMLMSGADAVATDRLHAMVLCQLLDTPHLLVGEDGGKIRAFWDTWFAGDTLGTWYPSGHDAVAALQGRSR